MRRAVFIDSDILIDHLRKEKKALDFLDKEIEKGDILFLSVISRAEI
jgi:predicted nucleic acid-binding protein